jgi:DNA-binding CsgD family transcriptional regulator/type II secretory pathway predicted ATPase ExeA
VTALRDSGAAGEDAERRPRASRLATMVNRGLIGRDQERARLVERLDRAIAGEGGLILVAGEAGVGKTLLMDELAASTKAPVLRGAAARDSTPAYGPVVTALRSYLHVAPDGLDDCGPLGEHLRLLLPELGPAPERVDTTTLREAIRCALVKVAGDRGGLVILDDLQWSDAATLELLADLAPTLSETSLLLVGAYRSDELSREHPLRRMRIELRRKRALDEIALEPLDEAGTAALLESELGEAPSRPLVRTVYDRAQGLPFFVEELASALSTEARLQPGAGGLELAEGSEVSVPETVRDAVLLRCGDLSAEGRAAAEAAAVAGERFELQAVVELAGEDGVGELIELALVRESGEGRASFRHALVREALYRDVPWLRRRELHRELGERLEAREAPGVEVAPHWLGAHDEQRARRQLLRAATEFESVHAYRDAAGMARQALELWPEGEEVDERLTALESHGAWAELAGELPDAARSWREVSSLHRAAEDGPALAAAQRRLGRVYVLQGDRAGAIESLTAAADAFAESGDPGEAAADRLAASDFLQFAGRHGASLELSRRAAEEARAAGRTDLRSRAMTAEGVVLAKRGEFEPGMKLVEEGLSLALEHSLTTEAIDAYQRLGTTFETAGDYANAREALSSALDLCKIADDRQPEAGCVACMAYVLRELGEWPRTIEICRELIDSHEADGVRTIADGALGYIRGVRGELGPARRLLTAGLESARRLDILSMQVDCSASLALVADYDSDQGEALERCRFLLTRWEDSEDHHYAVWGLRFGASLFAQAGRIDEAHACAEGLTRIASDSGHGDALAALAHALGEIALADGEPELAAEQLGRAVELHRSLRIPAERAQILHRAGVTLAAAGERELAVERHAEAYRVARNLAARPLAGRAASAIEDLGESVEQRLGRVASDGEGSPLTRRELEVVRLVADGRTNREIAAELFLSPRTIDMHVRNILAKLDCRSRVEASIKAGEAGLLRG